MTRVQKFFTSLLTISFIMAMFVNINRPINLNVNKEEKGIEKKEQKDLEHYSNTPVTWGVGKNLNEKNQPVDPVKLQEKYKDFDCLFLDDSGEKNIYLTFDNGYENGLTHNILDTLKEKNVKAIFFLTYDYVNAEEELVKRMINEGHIIGNHSYYHSDMPKVSIEKAKENITKLHEFVKEKYNYEMNLFRFPMGNFSDRTLALAENLNYKTLFWSFAYKDWETNNQMDKEKALKILKERLHPGAIYLLHSVSKTNTEILGDFIDYAISSGYNFKIM